MLRCTLLLYFGGRTSCYFVHFCCTSVNTALHASSCYVVHFCCTSVSTLHVTLYTSVALRWTHFMLRCKLLLYFGKHTSYYVVHYCTLLLYFRKRISCYVVHFCCTLVSTLHGTLYTSVVLRQAHFMLRCTLLLYFGKHASCYVVYFCCTSVNTLHATLYTSVVLR